MYWLPIVDPDIVSCAISSADLGDYLLNDHAIAAVAGSVFGASGEGHLRMAYSCSAEECTRGLERLRTALASIGLKKKA